MGHKWLHGFSHSTHRRKRREKRSFFTDLRAFLGIFEC